MYCFIAGVPPDLPDMEERLAMLIETVSEYEGLVEIKGNTQHPNKIMLCFDSMEAMTAAQWMMELNGSEPRKGGRAGREAGEGDTDRYYGQQADGEGYGRNQDGRKGGGLPQDL